MDINKIVSNVKKNLTYNVLKYTNPELELEHKLQNAFTMPVKMHGVTDKYLLYQ